MDEGCLCRAVVLSLQLETWRLPRQGIKIESGLLRKLFETMTLSNAALLDFVRMKEHSKTTKDHSQKL